MRTLSGLMEPTGGGRGHDLFLIFGRVDNVNTPRRGGGRGRGGAAEQHQKKKKKK